jgi:hypothetical protein
MNSACHRLACAALSISLCGATGCRSLPNADAMTMATSTWNCVRLGSTRIACSRGNDVPLAYQVTVPLEAVVAPLYGVPCLLGICGGVFCAQDERLSVFTRMSQQGQEYDRIVGARDGVCAQSAGREFSCWSFDSIKASYKQYRYVVPVIYDESAEIFAFEYGEDTVFASEDLATRSHVIVPLGTTALLDGAIDIGVTDPVLQRVDWRLASAISRVCVLNGPNSDICNSAKQTVGLGAIEAMKISNVAKIDFESRHGCWLSVTGNAFCFGERAKGLYTACRIASVIDLSISPQSSCFSFMDGRFQCWQNSEDVFRMLCESA